MRLNDELVRRFLAHSLKKGNSVKHVGEQRRALRFLAARLKGRDLARLELRVLHPQVDGHHMRIATIKALYSYLRTVTFELTPEEDPTFGRVKTLQTKPKPGLNKALHRRDVRLAVRRLREPWRSRLALQAATGIHTSELLRFARSGRVVPYRGQEGACAFLELPHKGGQTHRVALNQRLAMLARKVLDEGSFTGEFYHKHVRAAGEFTPGRLRHTVATDLVNRGIDMAAVATFLGHRTPQTTRRWYARFAVPRNPLLGPRRGRLR